MPGELRYRAGDSHNRRLVFWRVTLVVGTCPHPSIRTEIRARSCVQRCIHPTRSGGKGPGARKNEGARFSETAVDRTIGLASKFGIKLRLRAIWRSASANSKSIMTSPPLVQHTFLNEKPIAVLSPRCKHSLRRYNKPDRPRLPDSKDAPPSNTTSTFHPSNRANGVHSTWGPGSLPQRAYDRQPSKSRNERVARRKS